MDSESDYEMTEDQRLGMLEIQKLQQELDDADEEEDDPDSYGLGYPDYDVTERLKEINEQWDKEPLPDSSRQRLIEFKQKLTDVYEPPSSPEPKDDVYEYDNDFDPEGEDDEQGGLSDTNSKSSGVKAEDNFSAERLPGKPLPSEADGSLTHEPKSKPFNFQASGDSVKSNNNKSDDHTNMRVGFSSADQPKKERRVGFSGSDQLSDDEEKSRSDGNQRGKTTQFKSSNPDQGMNSNNSASSTDSKDSIYSIDEKENGTALKQSQNAPNESTNSSSTSSPVKVSARTGNSTNSQDKDNTSSRARYSNKNSEERVLIEINGKFEHVSVSELQAMGYPIPDELTSENGSSASTSSSQLDAHYNGYKRTNRPTTSVGNRSQSSSTNRGERRRAHSANVLSSPNRGSDWDASSYRSPYALTPEQKEMKERREKIIQERMLMERDRKREEERKKQEEAESAFQWWLSKKEEERRERHSVNRQSKEESEESKRQENESAFLEWCEAKKEQEKKERLLKLRERKERDDGYFLRSREECDQAFKNWLKNKRKQEVIISTAALGKSRKNRNKTRYKSTSSSNSNKLGLRLSMKA